MASVSSHGGTPPASPMNGSTSSGRSWRDPNVAASVASRPSRRPTSSPRRSATSAAAGGASLTPTDVAWSPTQPWRSLAPVRRIGRARRAAGLLHGVGERLGDPPAAADEHELRRRQRIAEVGHERRHLVGAEAPDVARDHDPPLGQERRGLGAVDDRRAPRRRRRRTRRPSASGRRPPTSSWTRSVTAARRIDSSSPVRRCTDMAAAHHGGRVRGPATGAGDRAPDRTSHTTATTSAAQPIHDHGGAVRPRRPRWPRRRPTTRPSRPAPSPPARRRARRRRRGTPAARRASPARRPARRRGWPPCPISESRPNTSRLGSSDAALRAERDGDRQRQRPEPHEPRREVHGAEHHAGGRPDRQPEPDRPRRAAGRAAAGRRRRPRAGAAARPGDPARTPSPPGRPSRRPGAPTARPA